VLAIKTAGQTWESTVNATVKQVLENGSKPAAGTQPGKHRGEPNVAPSGSPSMRMSLPIRRDLYSPA
jgi:hypothetical protein